MADKDLHLLLGEIKGKLELVIDNQQGHNDKIDALDARMGKVEIKAATNGMFAGSIAAVGIAIVRDKFGI